MPSSRQQSIRRTQHTAASFICITTKSHSLTQFHTVLVLLSYWIITAFLRHRPLLNPNFLKNLPKVPQLLKPKFPQIALLNTYNILRKKIPRHCRTLIHSFIYPTFSSNFCIVPAPKRLCSNSAMHCSLDPICCWHESWFNHRSSR